LRSAIDTTIAGGPRYPEGTVFVPADTPDLPTVLRRYRESRAPVIVVYEDGHEELIAGPSALDRFVLGALLGLIAAFVIDRIVGGRTLA
jgi:hypothetical protein